MTATRAKKYFLSVKMAKFKNLLLENILFHNFNRLVGIAHKITIAKRKLYPAYRIAFAAIGPRVTPS
ncbi:hypothetical protein NUACC26_046590 [Scytonema sp. NUACC26]